MVQNLSKKIKVTVAC